MSTSVSSLPSFTSPPVVEVAVGVEFLQLPGLGAIQLVALHDLWREEFPELREQVALPPSSPMDGPQGFQFQFMDGPPALRLWMLKPDEDELLQVQNDRLFLNWRRATGGNREYPRYDHLRATYQRVFSDFQKRIAESDAGALRPHTAAVTYVNRFSLAPGDQLKDAIAPLNDSWNLIEGAAPEVRISAPVISGIGADQLTGRLIAFASADETESGYGYLQVDARISLADPGVDIFSCLDLAHETCVTSFEKLTTRKMHERWGQK